MEGKYIYLSISKKANHKWVAEIIQHLTDDLGINPEYIRRWEGGDYSPSVLSKAGLVVVMSHDTSFYSNILYASKGCISEANTAMNHNIPTYACGVESDSLDKVQNPLTRVRKITNIDIDDPNDWAYNYGCIYSSSNHLYLTWRQIIGEHLPHLRMPVWDEMWNNTECEKRENPFDKEKIFTKEDSFDRSLLLL